MTISVKNLLLNSTRLTAVSSALAIGTMMFMAPAAYAQCSPDPTTGADTITCTGDTGTVDLDLDDGDDTITLTGANPTSTPNFDVNGDNGNDTIILINSFVDALRGDSNQASNMEGNDVITITASTVRQNISLGDGNDQLTAIDSEIGGTIFSRNGSLGNNTVNLTNVTGVNSIQLDDGNDMVTLVNAELSGSVTLGDGTDILTATGGLINGSISSTDGDDTVTLTNVMDVNSINLDEGADTVVLDNTILSGQLDVGLNNDNDGIDMVSLLNGSEVGSIDVGDANDVIVITGSEVRGTVTLGDGNDMLTATNSVIGGSINSTGGDDTVILNNVTDINGINIDDGADVVELTMITLSGGLDVGNNQTTGNNADGADTVTLTMSDIGGTVQLGEFDDVLTATDGRINGSITSNGGDDSVSLTNIIDVNSIQIAEGADTVVLNNTTLSGTLDVGLNNDNDGIDSVTVQNGSEIGSLDLGFDNDVAVITDSEVTASVVLGQGNDSLTATDSRINGSVTSVGGDDIVSLTNVIDVNSIQIAEGADTVVLNNTILSGTLDVGLNNDNDGADDVTVQNGSMIGSFIDLGFDDDTVTIASNSVVDGNILGGDGNDTINVLSGATTSDVLSGDGDDIVTITGGIVGGTVGSEGIDTGNGNDTVLLNGTVNGFVNLGDDDDTITLDANAIIDTTNANSLVAGDGSDNVTINGGTFNGISQNSGVNDFAVVDELVINGGTIEGQVLLNGGNDLVTLNGGTLVEGIGIVGNGFQQETVVINGGVVGTQPGNGHAVFTGEDEDQVGIFGGDVQSFISLGGGDDLLVIDAGADEFTTADTQVFVENGFAPGNPNQLHDPATNDLDHTATGSALIATPTQFFGGGGSNVAEIFDLVETSNLDFESFDDVNFYGLSITLADDAAGEAAQNIGTTRLLRGSTLTQTTGGLDIIGTGQGSTLFVDGTSTVTLQDGVVGDNISVNTFAPQAGSILAVDVDVAGRGLNPNDSDFIIGTVHTPEAGAIVDVNAIGATSLSGSRRIVDGGPDVADPGIGAQLAPSSTYVLAQELSTGNREFALVDAPDGGVFLVWTTPVSAETANAFFGGGTLLAGQTAADADLAVSVDGAGALSTDVAATAGAFTAFDNIADLAAAGAGARVGVSSAGTQGGTSRPRTADNGSYITCSKGHKRNAWVAGSLSDTSFGATDGTGQSVSFGVEQDLGKLFETSCGQVAIGAFGYFGSSDLDQDFGAETDISSSGFGGYLRGSTKNGFYGAVAGQAGFNNVEVENAVLESVSDYDTDTAGISLTAGKVTGLGNGLNFDVRGNAYFGTTGSDAFADSNGLAIDSIGGSSEVYSGTGELSKSFGETLGVYGRGGVRYRESSNTLRAFDIDVNSNPDVTTAIGEIGVDGILGERATWQLAGFGETGSDVEIFGGRARLSVKF